MIEDTNITIIFGRLKLLIIMIRVTLYTNDTNLTLYNFSSKDCFVFYFRILKDSLKYI